MAVDHGRADVLGAAPGRPASDSPSHLTEAIYFQPVAANLFVVDVPRNGVERLSSECGSCSTIDMARLAHGLSQVREKVRARGVEQAIDRRSSGWREMTEFREALLSDLGGVDALSVEKTTLVDLAAQTLLFLNHVLAV